MSELTVDAPSDVWYETIKEESISFLMGDNNSPWAILAETAIGLLPYLGQIVDARDIIKGLVEVADAPDSKLAWFNLITALIGIVPLGGDAAKRSMRAVKSGDANVDDLTAMIRYFYKGDPEKLLREVMDLSVLKKKLDTLLTNSRLLNRLSPQTRQRVDSVRAGLDEHYTEFRKEIDGWMMRDRRTSAEAPMIPRQKYGTPQNKPGNDPDEVRWTHDDFANTVRTNQPNTATLRTARFKRVSNKLLGVLGEHMADYYCQDVLGWGEGQAHHDQSEINTAKLNDGHRLVQLWPSIARGRGIDAVWKTNSGKPYAIIEAKASFNPAKTLGQLLGEAGDKNERDTGKGESESGKGGGLQGKRGKATPTERRQRNGKVTQMSHLWIKNRIAKAIGMNSPHLKTLKRAGRSGYSRHVLLFSIPHAAAHSEALILHAANSNVRHTMHSYHEVTKEWVDNQIERVVSGRYSSDGDLNSKERD